MPASARQSCASARENATPSITAWATSIAARVGVEPEQDATRVRVVVGGALAGEVGEEQDARRAAPSRLDPGEQGRDVGLAEQAGCPAERSWRR